MPEPLWKTILKFAGGGALFAALFILGWWTSQNYF